LHFLSFHGYDKDKYITIWGKFMKHTNSFKIGLIAVTSFMSCTGIVQADSANVRGTYQKMSGILNAMKNEALNPNTNISNTYSGKLLGNLEAAQMDANRAAAVSSGGQSSGDGLSILVKLAAAATDSNVIQEFSPDAQQKIATELDGSLETLTDQADLDDANAVLDALEAGGTPLVKVVNTPSRRRGARRVKGAYVAGGRYTTAQVPNDWTSRFAKYDRLRQTGG
jgi:hypothetical protein